MLLITVVKILLSCFISTILYINFIANNIRQKKDEYILTYFDGILLIVRSFKRTKLKYKYYFHKDGKKQKLHILDDMMNEFDNDILDSDFITRKLIPRGTLVHNTSKSNKDIQTTYFRYYTKQIITILIILSIVMIMMYSNDLCLVLTLTTLLLLNEVSPHENRGKYSVLFIKHNGIKQKLFVTNS